MKPAGLLLALFLLDGCAAIFRGPMQEIKVKSFPPEARASSDTDSAGTRSCVTPCTLKLRRNRSHEVTVTLNGWRSEKITITTTFEAGFLVLDLLLWGPFGLLDLDGSASTLEPEEVNVTLREVPREDPPQRPRQRRGVVVHP